MSTLEATSAAIRNFKTRYGVEASDENTIAALHIMNEHGLDPHIALDQSSRSANDYGIDAWHFDPGEQHLFVYQSKLSQSRNAAARGLKDLGRAREWVEDVMVRGVVEKVPASNHALFNLFTTLSHIRSDVRRVTFGLLSHVDENEVESLEEYDELVRDITRSELNTEIRSRSGGQLAVRALPYNLERAVPRRVATYPVDRLADTRIALRDNAHLDLAYLSLHSLVQLYRQRGDVLFDKNVRLSLVGNKDTRDRLVNPMEATLTAIARGELSPSIFSFYHIGVTLAATRSELAGNSHLQLESPSIINGCQTITIADGFLRKLEKQNDAAAIDRFKEVRVIAKVVVGTSNDELKEITNANNRQNPIENWQLFSNEPVQIEIELALKDIGVFYERQRGRFEATMRNAENARYYPRTNGTYVRVTDLAQLISLSRGQIAAAAKPSDIFANKETHDSLFDRFAARSPRDVVFTYNVHKALRRALNNYLELPAHANSNAPTIFKKQVIRAHFYGLGLLHYYQSANRDQARRQYSTSLHKKALPGLVAEIESVFCPKTVGKIRKWYTDESKDLSVEVSKRRTDSFFDTLASELGIDDRGARPFTSQYLDWSQYPA